MQNIDLSTLPGVISPKTKKPRRAVLVTTARRGIFFGFLASKVDKTRVSLTRCRNVVYFDAGTKGFMGLAANGPSKECRIGPCSSRKAVLFDITSVVEVTDEAAARFEEAPWSR